MTGSTGSGATVAQLWRFPVKSMRGERLDRAEVTPTGVLGDRAYAVLDMESGKIASGKSVRLFPALFACQAAYVDPPAAGQDLPPVRMILGDGTVVLSDSPDVDRVLSAYLGREVVLARSAQDGFTIDQYHPDVEGADPAGYRDTVVEVQLGSAFFASVGQASPVPAGSFFDLFPVSVVTTSTLDRLTELAPDSRFDPRRFRMNLVVATEEPGFVEDGWIGRQLALDGGAVLAVTMPDPRCVMTTLAQEELPKDTDILRALVRHHRLDVGGGALFPCVGVYAVVAAAGTVHLGDAVAIA